MYWYFYNFITYFYTHAKLGLDNLIKILSNLLDSNIHFVFSILQLVYITCKQVAPVQVLYFPTFYLTFMWIMIEVSTSLGYIRGLQITVGH